MATYASLAEEFGVEAEELAAFLGFAEGDVDLGAGADPLQGGWESRVRELWAAGEPV